MPRASQFRRIAQLSRNCFHSTSVTIIIQLKIIAKHRSMRSFNTVVALVPEGPSMSTMKFATIAHNPKATPIIVIGAKMKGAFFFGEYWSPRMGRSKIPIDKAG